MRQRQQVFKERKHGLERKLTYLQFVQLAQFDVHMHIFNVCCSPHMRVGMLNQVRSPKRLQVKFTETTISTPQLVGDLQLPDAFEFNGQKFDFSPLQGIADQVGYCYRSQNFKWAKQSIHCACKPRADDCNDALPI